MIVLENKLILNVSFFCYLNCCTGKFYLVDLMMFQQIEKKVNQKFESCLNSAKEKRALQMEK